MYDAIVAFLYARLDEREERARAWERLEQPWDNHSPGECDPCDEARRRIANEADHADFEDLAFELADVAAHRKLVAGLADTLVNYCDDGEVPLAQWVLTMLALPHAEHPEYRQEWEWAA